MPQLDRLPPDQRAVLSLVLEQGKSYGEVAELLGLSEHAVREWAHAALDALATAGAAIPDRNGATKAATVARTTPPTFEAAAPILDAPSTPPRPVMTATADELPVSTTHAPADEPSTPAMTATADQPLPPAREAQRPAAPRDRTPEVMSRGSRLKGALLLAVIALAVVIAVIVISGGGGKSSAPTTSSSTSGSKSGATSTPGSTGASTAAAGTPTVDKRLTLTSTEPGSKASGVGFVLSEGSHRAFYVAAQSLPPSSGFFYAVWLYDSPSKAAPLGRAPTVGSDGRMEGGGPLPSNASGYSKLIVTRETSTRPLRPGPIVLSGHFALH